MIKKNGGGLGKYNPHAKYSCPKCHFTCRHKTLLTNHHCINIKYGKGEK